METRYIKTNNLTQTGLNGYEEIDETIQFAEDLDGVFCERDCVGCPLIFVFNKKYNIFELLEHLESNLVLTENLK